jgi:hypothetical protein
MAQRTKKGKLSTVSRRLSAVSRQLSALSWAIPFVAIRFSLFARKKFATAIRNRDQIPNSVK